MSSRSPRVFLVRHGTCPPATRRTDDAGETAWSLSGAHTSTTELSLTARGRAQVERTAAAVAATGLIRAGGLAQVIVSPRARAQETLELLLGAELAPLRAAGRVSVDEAVREWDYGAYEGKVRAEVQAMRGGDAVPAWDIWRHGCEGGESPAQVAARLDGVAARVRELQRPWLDGGAGDGQGSGDVLVVAHGHSLRALAKRWCGLAMDDSVPFMLDTAAVAVLGYQHGSVLEPALYLGVQMGEESILAEE
jgi:broad specificity phosphatase PhoE